MSNQTPPPPPPPPTPSSAPPPPPAEAATGDARRRTGGRKAILGGVAAAVVLGGGFAAYAVYDRLDGGGAQPHDVMPASTQFYARLDLDPSAGQKIALFRLIRKFPDLANEIGIKDEDQDVRKLVFDEALKGCDGLDYEDDIKPWLGDRVGFGGQVEDEKFVIAVQTKDEGKSRDGIKKLFACGDEKYGIAYLDGYAILAPDQASVDASVKAAEKATLGDAKRFTEDFEELGGEGIASAWVDVKSLAELPEAKEMFGEQLDELAEAGSVATTLRVDGNAIEFAAMGGVGRPSDAKAVDLAGLPSDTVAALSVAGLGEQVAEGFDGLVEGFDAGFGAGFASSYAADPRAVTPDPDPSATPGVSPDDEDLDPLDEDSMADEGMPSSAQDFIDEIERSTGFKLPEDLETLFGDSLTLTIGGENLETIPTMSGPDGLTTLDVALSLVSDRTKALELVERIASLATDSGIPLVTSATDDGAVLATNTEAADGVASGDGGLGDEKAFKEVIPDGDKAYGGFYVNIGAILDKLLEADPPSAIRSGIEEAEPLSAFGVSVTETDKNRSLTRVRLSFK